MKTLFALAFVLTTATLATQYAYTDTTTTTTAVKTASVEDTIIDGHHKYESLIQAIGAQGLVTVTESVDDMRHVDVTTISYSALNASSQVLFALKNISTTNSKAVNMTYFIDGTKGADFSRVQDAHVLTDDEATFVRDGDKLVINFIKDVSINNQLVSGSITIDLAVEHRIP